MGRRLRRRCTVVAPPLPGTTRLELPPAWSARASRVYCPSLSRGPSAPTGESMNCALLMAGVAGVTRALWTPIHQSCNHPCRRCAAGAEGSNRLGQYGIRCAAKLGALRDEARKTVSGVAAPEPIVRVIKPCQAGTDFEQSNQEGPGAKAQMLDEKRGAGDPPPCAMRGRRTEARSLPLAS